MHKYRNIDKCVEAYLKRQLKHYKQLKALRTTIHTICGILVITLLPYGIPIVPAIFGEYKDSIGVWGIVLFVAYVFFVFALAMHISEGKGALAVLEREYKEGRYVWWDSGHRNHKRETYGEHNKERFFNAMVEASINVCGSETCCHSYSEDYVKDSMLFLEILWHKYNCDKEVRKEWFHIGVGDVRKITLSDARDINDHKDEIRWDFKAKEK